MEAAWKELWSCGMELEARFFGSVLWPDFRVLLFWGGVPCGCVGPEKQKQERNENEKI
jgi:hypothetical protein